MYVAVRAELDARAQERTVLARSSGCTWAELGEEAGLSAVGGRRRHLGVDPIFARRLPKPPTIDEIHAELFGLRR